MNKRSFAREWLWLVACFPVAWAGGVVYYYRSLGAWNREILGIRSIVDVADDGDMIAVAIPVAVGIYVLVGIVRITLWALQIVRQPPPT